MFHISCAYYLLYVPYMQIFFKKMHAYVVTASVNLG